MNWCHVSSNNISLVSPLSTHFTYPLFHTSSYPDAYLIPITNTHRFQSEKSFLCVCLVFHNGLLEDLVIIFSSSPHWLFLQDLVEIKPLTIMFPSESYSVHRLLFPQYHQENQHDRMDLKFIIQKWNVDAKDYLSLLSPAHTYTGSFVHFFSLS